MRGAPPCGQWCYQRIRIIPADAGSTWPRFARPRTTRDHPRGCGEHEYEDPARPVWPGSSPRMRGAPVDPQTVGNVGGIIPADAGSTPTPTRPSCRPWDHPRGCGEHLGLLTRLLILWGSSPRMRGAHVITSCSKPLDGIIPADAGSTVYMSSDSSIRWDHPRGCGEHPPLGWSPSAVCGSSPRMRGAHDREKTCGQVLRIIPADAGSTARMPCRRA